MLYFDRVCAVEVSPDIKVEDLRIKFEVKKNIQPNLNSCKIEIYNLSTEVRNRISSDADSIVRILAGYKFNEGLINIGVGNVSNVLHNVKNPNVITTIFVKDGFNSLLNNNISLSFIDKTPLNDVIDYIITQLAIPVKYTEFDASVLLNKGITFFGSISRILNLLSTQFNFTWSIQNGELLIFNSAAGTGLNSVLLSEKTGLIENPNLIIKSKQLAELNQTDYLVVALLQPQMEVGDSVVIDSDVLKGIFTVTSLTHLGDTRGNEWYTKMIVTNQ